MKEKQYLDLDNIYLADTHFHLDGAVLIKFAEALFNLPENKGKRPFDWEEKKKEYLTAPKDCQSLVEYLKCFDLPCSLLQTPNAMKLLTKMLVKELAYQGVNYVNFRFAPQQHSKNINNFAKYYHEKKIVESAIDGVEEAITELDCEERSIYVNFILCCMRNKNWGNNQTTLDNDNKRTIQIAKDLRENNCNKPRIIAIDLAGGEANNPTSSYEKILLEAEASGIPFIIHGGEAGTNKEKLANIEWAICHDALFIGHATALQCTFPRIQITQNGELCIADDFCTMEESKKAEELLEKIKEKNIFIECCLTSNMQTKAVAGGILFHPLAELLKRGVKIILCTDNMMVSGTDLKQEYEKAVEIFESQGYDKNQIEKFIKILNENAKEAAEICKTKSRENRISANCNRTDLHYPKNDNVK